MKIIDLQSRWKEVFFENIKKVNLPMKFILLLNTPLILEKFLGSVCQQDSRGSRALNPRGAWILIFGSAINFMKVATSCTPISSFWHCHGNMCLSTQWNQCPRNYPKCFWCFFFLRHCSEERRGRDRLFRLHLATVSCVVRIFSRGSVLQLRWGSG